MDMREVLELDRAVYLLITDPSTAHFSAVLISAAAEAKRHDHPMDYLLAQGGLAARLVRLQLGGYLDPAAHRDRPVPVDYATDWGLYPPSPEERARLSRLPSVGELLSLIQRDRPGQEATR
jgi:hypothetical protein